VDFGIVAGKKALPHAQDLAHAIEEAFQQAQAVLVTSAEPRTRTAPLKTPRTRGARGVASETTAKKPAAVKRARKPDMADMASTRRTVPTSNASRHGTTLRPAANAKKQSTAKPARRPPA
jgi:hypothetical protein